MLSTKTATKVKDWRRRTKQRLVDSFGGACNRCGYAKCLWAMDFHHIDPATKEFSISFALSHPTAWAKIVAEARKCVLLCGNCHTELHSGLWQLTEIVLRPYQEVLETPANTSATGTCSCCNNPTYYNNSCCSLSCGARRRCQIEWPSDDDLLKMFATHTNRQIADIVGVSDVAVWKKRKKLTKVVETP